MLRSAIIAGLLNGLLAVSVSAQASVGSIPQAAIPSVAASGPLCGTGTQGSVMACGASTTFPGSLAAAAASLATPLAAASGGTGNPGGAWSCAAATPTGQTGTFTSVAATVCTLKSGRTVQARIRVTDTTNGSAAGYVAVPMTYQAATDTPCVGKEIGATGYALTGQVNGSNTNLVISRYDAAYPGGNGYVLVLSCTYEAAS